MLVVDFRTVLAFTSETKQADFRLAEKVCLLVLFEAVEGSCICEKTRPHSKT